MSEQTKPGGWTSFRHVNSTDVAKFKTIQFGLGITVFPRYVSTQVVNGVNYRFICDTYVVAPNNPCKIQLVNANQVPGASNLTLKEIGQDANLTFNQIRPILC